MCDCVHAGTSSNILSIHLNKMVELLLVREKSRWRFCLEAWWCHALPFTPAGTLRVPQLVAIKFRNSSGLTVSYFGSCSQRDIETKIFLTHWAVGLLWHFVQWIASVHFITVLTGRTAKCSWYLLCCLLMAWKGP